MTTPVDPTVLTDEQLHAAYAAATGAPPAGPVAPPPSAGAGLSDEELKAAYSKTTTSQAAGGPETFYDRLVGNAVDEQGHRFDLGTQLRSMAHGMPIVKRFVESTPESEAYEKAFPGPSTLNQLGGSTIALAPTMGFGLAPSLAVGAGVSGADTALGGGSAGDIATDAAIGAGTTGVGYGAGKLLGKVFQPYVADPLHKAAVATLKRFGVGNLTAGQELGNEALLGSEAAMAAQPWVNRQDVLALPKAQFTQAVLNHGINQAGLSTQGNIAAAGARIGSDFDAVTAGNSMFTHERQLVDDAQTIWRNYQANTSEYERKPIVENVLKGMFEQRPSALPGGTRPPGFLTGAEYQDMRSGIGKLAEDNASHAPTYRALTDAKEALDDAFERQISPDDRGALAEARRQYRNLLIIEKASAGSGSDAAKGYISPASLQTAIKSVQGTRAYARGWGDLSELANAGVAAMSKFPNSGTAAREGAVASTQLAGVLGGETLGRAVGRQIAGSAAGATASETANRYADSPVPDYAALMVGALAGPAIARGMVAAKGNALLSAPVQAYLKNQPLQGLNEAIVKQLGGAAGAAEGPSTVDWIRGKLGIGQKPKTIVDLIRGS